MEQDQTLLYTHRHSSSISLKLSGGSLHQIRYPLLTTDTDFEIVSHRRNTDESSDVILNENRVRQSGSSFTSVNGKEGNEDLSVCVGSVVKPASTLSDAGKPATTAAAITTTYAVARGLLSQYKDSSKVLDISANTRDNVHRQPSVNTSSKWSNPSVSRNSSSSTDDLINNQPPTEDVRGLRPTHVSGIRTPSFHALSIANQQHTSSCVTTTVSEASPVLKHSTQDSVFPSNNSNSSCEAVAVQSLLEVSGELPSSPEITPDDLPALLCSFLFGSPDTITTCDTVTILEQDPQTKCKNGSMDFMLSSLSSDTIQLQSHDKETRSYEILGASPSKIEAESVVSVSGYEISAGDAEKEDDEGGSEVQEERHTEQCVEDISATSTSTSPKKACRTRTRCRVSGRTSGHVKEVQRGISVESGYHTSSENHVKVGMETPSSEEKDKSGDRDDDDDDDDDVDDDDAKDNMNERLVLVPSGE